MLLRRLRSLASSLFLGALGLGLVVLLLRSSDASATAQAFLRSHPVLRQELGEPMEVGWLVIGHMRRRNDSGSASLRFSLRGSRESTTAWVTLARQWGAWQVTEGSYEAADGTSRSLRDLGNSRGGEARPASQWEEARRALARGHALYKSGQGRQALEELDRAVALDASQAEAWYWRAQVRTRLGELEQARRDIEQALAAGVQLREAYQLYDDLLAPSREWGLILAAWTRYLEAHPRDDVALMARAVAWRHSGDDARARQDLEQSCGLGYARACERLRR